MNSDVKEETAGIILLNQLAIMAALATLLSGSEPRNWREAYQNVRTAVDKTTNHLKWNAL